MLPNMEKSPQSLMVGDGPPVHVEHYHFDCFDAVFGGERGQRALFCRAQRCVSTVWNQIGEFLFWGRGKEAEKAGHSSFQCLALFHAVYSTDSASKRRGEFI